MTDINVQMNFYLECGNGWALYPANLKSVLEGGFDLRKKEINPRQVINT